jgi:autoinducer 2-degrading protein
MKTPKQWPDQGYALQETKCYHQAPAKFRYTAMQVTIVYISVKPEHIDEFIEATRQNHEASVLEPGNRRFDVLQSAENPARFILYEAYESVADAAKHKQTAHYRTWRETVADWMAEPRHGEAYNGLLPT